MRRSNLASTPPSSKADQVTDVAATTLEVSLGILSLIGDATENVPYLNTVTGCLKQLVDIRKAMKDNSNLAVELLDNIGDVACAVAKGLQELNTEQRNITLQGLREDLDAYETVLKDTRVIVEKWTSKHFIKRLLNRDGFPAIAATIERKIKGFRDAFTAKRLVILQKGQVQLDTKVQIVVDELTRTKLRKWLKPASVGRSQSDAANKRHPNTGNWFINGAEFAEWINTPGAFVWLEGISGSGKTVLSSTIIETLRVRGVPKAFFYFNTNNRGQQTVTQLLCSLVDQLSIQVNSPDKTLSALWQSHDDGNQFPSNTTLMSEALLPLLNQLKKSTYIVLDALDECSDRNRLLRWIKDIVDAKLPNVHLLLTSRPEVPRGNLSLSKRATSVSLEQGVEGDIGTYVTQLLLSDDLSWIQKKLPNVAQLLLEHANGMFRLVSLQLDELRRCDGRLSQIKKVLANMPTTLPAIYDRIFKNIADPEMRASVSRTMNWLVFSESQRPMKLIEVIDALAFDFTEEPLRFDPAERMRPEALVAACGGFVSLSKSTDGELIQLAHASVKEYFLLTTKHTELRGHVEVSKQAANYLIARTCIGYIYSIEHALQVDDDKLYPLIHRAANVHFKSCEDAAAGSLPRPLIEAAIDLLNPGTAQYTNLCCFTDGRNVSLHHALQVLLLGDVTEDSDIPYLNTVTKGLAELVKLSNLATEVEHYTAKLLPRIGVVALAIAQELRALPKDHRSTAVHSLTSRYDLRKFSRLLENVCRILRQWTSKDAFTRWWTARDFPTDKIEREINVFFATK